MSNERDNQNRNKQNPNQQPDKDRDTDRGQNPKRPGHENDLNKGQKKDQYNNDNR